MGEYRMVLSRKKFNFPIEMIEPLIDFIKYEGEFIASEPLRTNFTNEDDEMFLEVAVSGNAEYLITGNTKYVPGFSQQENVLIRALTCGQRPR